MEPQPPSDEEQDLNIAHRCELSQKKKKRNRKNLQATWGQISLVGLWAPSLPGNHFYSFTSALVFPLITCPEGERKEMGGYVRWAGCLLYTFSFNFPRLALVVLPPFCKANKLVRYLVHCHPDNGGSNMKIHVYLNPKYFNHGMLFLSETWLLYFEPFF